VAKVLFPQDCKPVAGSLAPCEPAKPTGKQKQLQDELKRIQLRVYKMAAAFSKKFDGAELHINTEERESYNPFGGSGVEYSASANFTFRPKKREQ
jgi:hypothetical protein